MSNFLSNFIFALIAQTFSGNRLNPIQTGGGGGLLEPAPTLKIRNFQTVKAMTTKFSDFS